MKNKWLMVLTLGLLTAALAVVPALAHGGEPPVNPQEAPFGGPAFARGADGFMHEEMVNWLADALGVDAAEVQARLDAGETMYDILAEAGLSQTDFYALMQDFRTQAMQQAVDNGWMTAEQYEWMLQRMNGGFGGMMGRGAYGGMTDGSAYGPRGGGWMGARGGMGTGDCTGTGAPMGGAYGSQNRP